ncbi:MAG: lysoplasmalogenase [Chitinophagaceae bacterium]|nr:lysoplasmalogenase [Chitinophagaceae bacterium]
MKIKILIVVFLVTLAADILGAEVNNEAIQFATKPLLMPLLALLFLSAMRGKKCRLSFLVLLALFFSWLGDVLLMFQGKQSVFFLSGLSAFLLAHVVYIIFFHKIRIAESVMSRWWILLMVAAYYTGLIIWFSPYLGEMKLPVRIYGLVISFMLMMALHMLYLSNKKAGVLFVTGAVLFVISDSILAINKFYKPLWGASAWIMITYGWPSY